MYPHLSRTLQIKHSHMLSRSTRGYRSGSGPMRTFSSSAFLSADRLTHIDEDGRASMVDVSEKLITKRSATAMGRIYIPRVAYELVTSAYPSGNPHTTESASPLQKAKAKASRKGDTLTVAQLAAIMGSKKTSDLIPLCHPIPLTNVQVSLTPEAVENTTGAHRYSILCRATVTCEGKTGVEMEALTSCSVGLLTIWDMLKAVAGKEMVIGGIFVAEKSGGRSADFHRTLSMDQE